MCRYVLRPPFAQERLRRRGDGRVALELKRAWHDGTRELVFEPLKFLERLAAMTPRPEANLVICHGVLAPRARWRGRVVLDGTLGRRSGGYGSEDRQSARLELGGPDAPGVWHRRAGVCPVWRPPPPDRHAARSRGHPEDPHASRPLPLGAESRPGPSRLRRRRVLIGSTWGVGGGRSAGAAKGHCCQFGRSAGRLTPGCDSPSMPLTRPRSLDPRGGRSCALWHRAPGAAGV